MERFLQLFGHFVQFSYGCWDRIVLRGCGLQRPENIVHFFREVCGDARITPAVLARRTATYRRWLESYTEQHRIPLLTAPKGVRKEEVVAPYHRSFKPDTGVVVILKSMEQSSTYSSYEPRHAPPSGDDYRLIKRAPKRFLNYYFYVLDPVMGAMSLWRRLLSAVLGELLHERPFLRRRGTAPSGSRVPHGRQRDRALRRSRVADQHRRPPRRAHPAAARQLLGQPPGAPASVPANVRPANSIISGQ